MPSKLTGSADVICVRVPSFGLKVAGEMSMSDPTVTFCESVAAIVMKSVLPPLFK